LSNALLVSDSEKKESSTRYASCLRAERTHGSLLLTVPCFAEKTKCVTFRVTCTYIHTHTHKHTHTHINTHINTYKASSRRDAQTNVSLRVPASSCRDKVSKEESSDTHSFLHAATLHLDELTQLGSRLAVIVDVPAQHHHQAIEQS